ncbi:hypothetical protein Llac01_09490 [Leuconostoc lactis]|uniref:hypothetical protein n=1 Tax=Leuconostoc lactis TaxID=1246 RepID=UPI00114383AC|nr:hypothetical protein [Leuconostoc lactis]GEB41156.1 hypothetical protein LLA04_15440 [Leuconostoc lactis]GLY45572.1 hypothetical protein Llac01_09490 [Leuconostoc lactis]
MFFNKNQQDTTNDVEVLSSKTDDTNKILALKRKRDLYTNDIDNIDNNKLRISYIRSGLWLIVLGIICFIIALSITNIKNSFLITLMTLGVTTFLAFLNIFILLQNRKYDDIQKINDIQYELKLCDGYMIEDDFVNINNGKQSIQIFLQNGISDLDVNRKTHKRNKTKLWKIIAITVIIAILFDLVLYRSVIDSIAQSTNSVLLTLLALAVSENKLLQKFVTLNDKKYREKPERLYKQFFVIAVTSLVTLGTLAGLLDKVIRHWYPNTNALMIMIIVVAIQTAILAITNYYVEKGNSAFVSFISE